MPISSTYVSWSPVAPPVDGLILPLRMDPLGEIGPTRGQAQGAAWVRTDHGWYVHVTAPRHLVEQHILEQTVRLPRGGAVTGWAACRLHGAAYFDGLAPDGRTWLPVPLAIGPQRSLPTTPRATPHHHVLLPRDRTLRLGIPTVVVERATFDAMRFAASLREAVRCFDMMAAAGLCSLQMVREYAARQPQHRVKVLRALALASEHALSPPEVDVRLVHELDLGLPRALVNPVIHDRDGRQVAMVDLLDVEAGLVMEVDGPHHRHASVAAADNRRTTVLHRLGLEVVRFTGTEARRVRLVADRLSVARSRSRFAPPAGRAWYAVPQADTLHERIVAGGHHRHEPA